MKLLKNTTTLIVLVFLLQFAVSAHAGILNFEANLDGAQEVGPKATPATGFGTVVLDDVALTITVNLSWTDLTAPPTAGHIHGPAPIGANAPVVFPFGGLPALTSGSMAEQTFAVTDAQVAQFEAGLFYMNLHNANFPSGEIRGQLLAVPDHGPGILGLLTLAGICLVALPRRQLS